MRERPSSKGSLAQTIFLEQPLLSVEKKRCAIKVPTRLTGSVNETWLTAAKWPD
jgi:hypothetical protein